ncbi:MULTISPECIES: LCP family protein [Bacillaceae]|uniref:LCP family protein n=1 Tax=Bacillaceae TaxID=186817 RepID=UPI002A15CBED|nr:LCP family protein [Cytobacillus sp. IB215316]MDX8361186.1 LCP family protein [Cytobacillus sp. IB215316]
MKDNQDNKSGKVISKRRKRLIIFIIPVLIIIIAATAYGANLYIKAQNAFENSREVPTNEDTSSPPVQEAIIKKKDNFSLLIMGIENSETRVDANNVDALLLATFNEEKKSVKLLHIPRDSYVYIPYKDSKDKITHSNNGGTQATIETVSQLLDLPIDRYIKLDFNAFVAIVDALGGIEVDVPITFSEQDSQDRLNSIYIEKGLQTLTGEEALALARVRKLDNDFERGKRQQLIIEAIIDKAASLGSITKYGTMIEALGDNLKHNFATFSEITSLYKYATPDLTIETLQLQGYDSTAGAAYIFELDETYLEEVKKELQDHLEDVEPPNNESSNNEQ